MPLQSPNDSRNATTIWMGVFVACVAALVGLFTVVWPRVAPRDGGRVPPGLGSAVFQMEIALPRFGKYYYPSFASMPTNVLLTTSRVFFDAWPKLGALIVTGEERPRASTNTGLVDCFGNNYNLIMNQLSALGATTVTYQVMMWSNGPNGTNEYGKGDDWPRTFTFTVDPTLPPLE